MTSGPADPVLFALRDPARLVSFSLPQWETLVRQARRTNLLARVALALDDLGLVPRVPAAPRTHLYYRRWMHELPPLRHISRRTWLDVHHAILPITARLKPDSAKLLAASRPVTGEPRLRVLEPVDMVLHSAAHLFCNEDVGNSLRDLLDLDSLLREFARDEAFWPRLSVRAGELDLTRPLYYALRYAVRLLDTPVPDRVLGAAEIGRPPTLLRGLMDALFLRTLQPNPASDGVASLARGSL